MGMAYLLTLIRAGLYTNNCFVGILILFHWARTNYILQGNVWFVLVGAVACGLS